MNAYELRRGRLYDWMAREGVSLAMFEDVEGRRDFAIRWLTGQPGDALLFLSVERRSLLVPWDINLAKLMANADLLVPYGDFERDPITAARQAAVMLKIPADSKIEIPSVTPYLSFLKYVEALDGFNLLCRSDGAGEACVKFRSIKDEEELRLIKKAAGITNSVMDMLEKKVRSGALKTEIDAAMFIEAEGRKRGAEGTGFETIAAGPSRSFGIHAFPACTAESFGGPGFSILDFGLRYCGYTTDVTMTFARPPLSSAQEKMISLVEKAYAAGLSMAYPGTEARNIALAVEALFKKSKKQMPHALGHGIGLEAHEAPFIRTRADNKWQLEAGMVFSLEPGLYDTAHGGCRLENNIYLGGSGAVELTSARIVRL